MSTGFIAVAAVLSLLALAWPLRALMGPRSQAPAVREFSLLRRQLAAARLEHARGRLSDAAWEAQQAEAATRAAELLAVEAPAPPARSLAAVLTLMLPIAALALYLHLGTPAALQPEPAVPASDMDAALAQLEARLASDPDRLEDWVLLARSYQALERHDEAVAALRRALQLAPNDPDVMALLANALAFADPQGRVPAEAVALLDGALRADPDAQRALYLRGIAAFQAGASEDALSYWERLRQRLDPTSPAGVELDRQIAAARQSIAGESERALGGVEVSLSLAESLQDRVAEGDVLFVFARAAEGPRMPLAIARLRAAQLPTTVRLTDDMGMLPDLKLSDAEEIIVGARISRSGNATPQPGDLQALSEPLAPAQSPRVELVIDSVL